MAGGQCQHCTMSGCQRHCDTRRSGTFASKNAPENLTQESAGEGRRMNAKALYGTVHSRTRALRQICADCDGAVKIISRRPWNGSDGW